MKPAVLVGHDSFGLVGRLPMLVMLSLLLLSGLSAQGQREAPEAVVLPTPAGPELSGETLEFGYLWSRSGQARMVMGRPGDLADPARGSVVLENNSAEDWALDSLPLAEILPGEIWEFSVTVALEGGAAASAGFTWRREDGEVLDWVAGAATLSQPGIQRLQARFGVGQNGEILIPRIIGWGQGRITLSHPRIRLLRRLVVQPGGGALAWESGGHVLELESGGRNWTLSTPSGTFGVEGSGPLWQGESPRELLFAGLHSGRPVFYHPASDTELELEVMPQRQRPEWTLEWRPRSDGAWEGFVGAGPRWSSLGGDRIILPLNQGVDLPVEHATFPSQWLVGAGGHGMSLPFWSQIRGDRQLVTLFDRSEDAGILMDRHLGLHRARSVWRPSLERWNGARRLHLALVEGDSLNDLALWYRSRLESEGRLPRNWAQKIQEVPATRNLLGAANIYIEGNGAVPARDIRGWGWDRVLWSSGGNRAYIEEHQALGWLVGRYDIYQDVMDPAQDAQYQPHMNRAWPRDIILDAQGQPVPGWVVRYPDGREVACGVLDDRRATVYARPLVASELAELPYQARFIDTTTATDLRENYRPGDQMDRSASLVARQELLSLMSGEFGLVTGSETGTHWAVDQVHYYEGMMGLAPFRDPEAGYHMGDIIDPPPAGVGFNFDPEIRVPLWELIHRDSVVSYWYWGDGNNKFPALWLDRDRFNILYATPPLYYLRIRDWPRYREQVNASYQRIRPATRAAGQAAMTEFLYLTPDRRVQQTLFANGSRITVNFGSGDYRDPAGRTLEAGAWRVEAGE